MFGHTLHMHQTGQHMVTRQYRNDELVYTSEVEYYSFDQAGAFMDNTDETLTIEVCSLEAGKTLRRTYNAYFYANARIFISRHRPSQTVHHCPGEN